MWPWCNCCKSTYNDCVSLWCKPDGSNAEYCARVCLTALCTFSKSSPEICHKGLCRLSACPKEKPKNVEDGQPADMFTTVLSLPATTVTVTLTPSPTTTPLPSVTPISSVPQCTPGRISRTSQWQAQMELHSDKDGAQLTWDLYDHNGCHAGAGKADQLLNDGSPISGRDISPYNAMAAISLAKPEPLVSPNQPSLSSSDDIIPHMGQLHNSPKYLRTEITSHNRPTQHAMAYWLDTRIDDPQSDHATATFTLMRPAALCKTQCLPSFSLSLDPSTSTTTNRWRITNSCASTCANTALLMPADIGCSAPSVSASHTRRTFWCWWRMPYAPGTYLDPPLAPDATWRIRLHQEMLFASASITWTLIDPHGYDAGSGLLSTDHEVASLSGVITSSPARLPAHALALSIQLTVSRPTVEAYTWMRFEFQKIGAKCRAECFPSLYTFSREGAMAPRPGYVDGWTFLSDCSGVCEGGVVDDTTTGCAFGGEDFAVKGAGREREFECWFKAY